ncbi:hypothetical protein [Thermus sp.]|nr:hypothetical protein [Thermus sp.]MDW8358764.1 hypothetical protein [Thermus sp.]
MAKEAAISPEDRRRFLSRIASAVFASMVAPGLAQGTPQAVPPQGGEEDALLRMQRDLERALSNPSRRWGMV